MYSFDKMFAHIAQKGHKFDSEFKGGSRTYTDNNGLKIDFWFTSRLTKIDVSINIAEGICYCEGKDMSGEDDQFGVCDCWFDGIISDSMSLSKTKFQKLYQSNQLRLF